MMNPEVMKHLVANPNVDLTKLPEHIKEIEVGVTELKNSIPNVVKLVEKRFNVTEGNYVKFEFLVNDNDIIVMVKEMKNLGEGKGDQFIKTHWSGELLDLFLQLRDENHEVRKFIEASKLDISILLFHVNKLEGGIRLLKNTIPAIMALINSEFDVQQGNFVKFELLPIGNDIVVTVKEMKNLGQGKGDQFIKMHWTGELLELFLNLKKQLPFEV